MYLYDPLFFICLCIHTHYNFLQIDFQNYDPLKDEEIQLFFEKDKTKKAYQASGFPNFNLEVYF